ncbi:WapI family immunity protein [Ideonella lacteola]|uniref:WapI family immunity protein n=1 Tax=Ideonella lacteola TaxID=2984193 RepID=UPI003BF9BF32
MILQSDANSLELRILGYQFPKNSSAKYDSNWLVIGCRVDAEGQAWTFQDPCLLTWEVGALIEHLEALASGATTRRSLGFTEPNLEFVSCSPSDLRVLFSLEASPPWLHDEPVQDCAFFIDFAVSPGQLLEAGASLRRQLDKFPARAGQHVFKGQV